MKISKQPDGYHIQFERKDWSKYSLKATVIPALKGIKKKGGLLGWMWLEDTCEWVIDLECGTQLENILDVYVRPIDEMEKHDKTVDMLTGMDRSELDLLKRGYGGR